MIVESYDDLIVLSGALRSNFWHTVHTAISLALRRSPEGVVIDCSGITECNAAGADTFRDIQGFIERQNARVIVAAVPENVMLVLRQVEEVRSQLPIASSVEEARTSLYRLSDADEHDGKAKKKRPTKAISTRYLVCLLQSSSDGYALKLACEHAEMNHAALTLLAPVLVPRDLPLQSPLPDEEQAAVSSLEKAETVCEERDIVSEKVMERGRDIATMILDAVTETGVSQVFLPLPGSTDGFDVDSKLVKSVLGKVSLPLHFVRDQV
ncbi:MAG: universal stress protein [Chthonomonas sp.]|nr:universal stress protein [Chthonomonas sp.]